MSELIDLNTLFASELGDTQQSLFNKGIAMADVPLGRMADVLAPKQASSLRKAAGGLFGVDTSTSKERLQQALTSLDLSNEGDQAKAVELVRAQSPAAALTLQQQFKRSKEASALNQAQIGNQQSQTLRRTQQTALETATMADEVTQREQRQANLDAAKPVTIKALKDASAANPALLTADLISAVQNNTMSPADVQTTLNNRLKLSTEANEWLRGNNNTIFQRGSGKTKDLPIQRNVTAVQSEGLLIGVDMATGDHVYTKRITDIVDASSPFTDTATTVVPSDAAAPLAAPSTSLNPAQIKYKSLLNEKLKGSEALVQQIKQARGLVGFTSAGFFSNVVRAVNPETEGDMAEAVFGQNNTNLRAAINPILASLGFDELQAMRSDPDNKTGGALGQVSNIELKMLQSAIADLGTEQSPVLLKANLGRIEKHYINFLQAELGIVPNIDVNNEIYKGNVGTTDSGEYIIRDPDTGRYRKIGMPGTMMTLERL
jgi:hypothetical protein